MLIDDLIFSTYIFVTPIYVTFVVAILGHILRLRCDHMPSMIFDVMCPRVSSHTQTTKCYGAYTAPGQTGLAADSDQSDQLDQVDHLEQLEQLEQLAQLEQLGLSIKQAVWSLRSGFIVMC